MTDRVINIDASFEALCSDLYHPKMKYLATGGIGWCCGMNGSQAQQVFSAGFRYGRLSVDEPGSVVAEDDSVTWSPAIQTYLDSITSFGFKLSINAASGGLPIGLMPGESTVFAPNPLEEFPETRYRTYIQNFLYYVTVTLGHDDIRIEVGNEMDFGNTWLTAEIGNLNPAVYTAYMYLYTMWAEEVSTFLSAHPTVTINLGGYAGSTDTWLETFPVDTASLKRDFVSFHYYGYGYGRYPDQTKLAIAASYAPVYITEWGWDPWNYNPALNRNEFVYYWTKEFLCRCARFWNISEMYFLSIRNDGIGIFWNDGAVSPYGRAIFELAQL